MKVCSKCGLSKPIESFSKRGSGYYGQCKSCIAKRKAEWRKAHPGYMNNYYSSHRRLKPLVTKTCPNCHKRFKTNRDYQVLCQKGCKPQTEIRRLKGYLLTHPEIDKHSFFAGRYYGRYIKPQRHLISTENRLFHG